uniref:MAC/Perforin domain-containing protein n=1 Tax=Toxoplasma gondii COUG TaxID=1074873 RepID=A0A2G8Y285_TOXGO|nr:MAC/Perforin domain-containing protein [Toxoplasma gondii COUG]
MDRTLSPPVEHASRAGSYLPKLPFAGLFKAGFKLVCLLVGVTLCVVQILLLDAAGSKPYEQKHAGLSYRSFWRSIRPHHVPTAIAGSLAQMKDDEFDFDWDDEEYDGGNAADDEQSTDAESDGDPDALTMTKQDSTNAFNVNEKSYVSTTQNARQSEQDFPTSSTSGFSNFGNVGTPAWARPGRGEAAPEPPAPVNSSSGQGPEPAFGALRRSIDASAPESMYTRAVETAPATNFLGVGYDSIKGNPIGDPDMMVDPGLRSPIIVFSFQQDPDGVTNDLNYLQPLGAFTRPFSACRQSENVNELDTLSDYQKVLSVDAALHGGDSLGINSFSGSTGYKEFAQDVSSKANKSFMLKTYCIRYEAGLAQTDSFKWNYTLAFDDAVAHLPVTFDGNERDTPCSVQQWRADHMADGCQQTNIPIWMAFIEQFGTHYTARLYAGGKMTYQVTMKSSDVKALKKKGVDVKAEVKLMLGGFSAGASSQVKTNQDSASQLRSLNVEKEALVIGGKPPADVSDPKAIAAWANSVDALPMPVKLELLPLQNLLPEDKREAFTHAVTYYSKAFGMSAMDVQSLEGTARSIQDVLKDVTQIAWAGAPPGYARCPREQVVLFGFAMRFNFKVTISNNLANYHIAPCTAGREKCDGIGAEEAAGDDERIYMACGPEVVNEFYQVVAETEAGENVAVATCPEDTVIAFGFGISIGTGFYSSENTQVEPCTAGQTRCTKARTSNTVKSYVWMVCAEKSFPGIAQLNNIAEVGTRGKANSRMKNTDGIVNVSCGADERTLLGLALEVHTHMPSVRKAFKVCTHDSNSCALNGAGEQLTVLYVDRHALFGWALCGRRHEEKSHVASDISKGA